MSNGNGKVVGVLVGGIALGAALGAGIVNGLKGKQTASTGGGSETCSVAGAAQDPGLFELDGKTYSREDLPSDVKDTLFQIQNQSYESTSNFAKEVALRFALASEQGGKADPTNLPQLRTLLSAEKIPEAELKKFYEENKKSIPPGTSFEQIKPQLEQFLSAQKVGEQARQKVAELQNAGRLKLLVSPPPAPVVNLTLDGYPTLGAPEAKTTLVEVSDYLCSHCRSVKSEVDSVVKEFGGKVKFVQVNFALNPTGLSGALARGGYCALKQGNDAFWKYHDKAFQVPPEAAQSVSPDAAKEFAATAAKAAADAGIKTEGFEACVNSDEAKKYVETTNSQMSSAGVSGTPTFFLNNKKLSLGSTTLAQAIKAEVN